MPTSPALRPPSSGPFRADQIRDGDPYELSNGHPILCMGASDRHGSSNAAGTLVIASDPAVERAGVDTGCAFNDGENLRAPDISVGNLTGKSGWAQGAPPLAVEYADRGQDERELLLKIAELLAHGTRYVWVVRIAGPGPVGVEVHEPGQRPRTVAEDGELVAPGILENPVPVRALVDPDAAKEATLRNLLNARGYASLDAVRENGLVEGLRQAVYDLAQVLDLPLPSARRAQIEALGAAELTALRTHIKSHRAWPK